LETWGLGEQGEVEIGEVEKLRARE